MREAYSLYSFVIEGSPDPLNPPPEASVDLSAFFLVPGVASSYRANLGWELVSVENGGGPGLVRVWVEGDVAADGSLGPATWVDPSVDIRWEDYKFTNLFSYSDQMALQIPFTPEPTKQCDNCSANDPTSSVCMAGARSSLDTGTELLSGRFMHSIPLLATDGVGLGGWGFDLRYFANSGYDDLVGKNFISRGLTFLEKLGDYSYQPEPSPIISNIELVSTGNARAIFRRNSPYTSVFSSDDNNSAADLTFYGTGADEEYKLISSDATISLFHGFDPAVAAPGRMKRITDRFGNSQSYEWRTVDGIAQLLSVTDAYGRVVEYRYYGSEFGYRLREVEDFLGRKLSFQYDELGHLIAVVTPAITQGAPGNTFPGGTAYVFQYDVQNPRPSRRDDLIRVWYPNQATPFLDEATRTVNVSRVYADAVPRYVIEYGQDPTDQDSWGRVVAETVGDPGNGVGGTYRYSYETLDPPESNPADFSHELTFRAAVTDRNGNRTIYDFNDQGLPAKVEVLRNRNKINIPDHSTFPSFITWTRYNDQGQPLRITHPEGNTEYFGYTFGSPGLTRIRGLPQFHSIEPGNQMGLPSREGSGGQTFLTTVYFYEPLFNQLCAVIERRGLPIDFDTMTGQYVYFQPQNEGTPSSNSDRTRYATYTYFDYQKDDLGTIISDSTLQSRLGYPSGTIQTLLLALDGRMKVMYGLPAGFPVNLGDINGDGTGIGASSGLPEATHLGNIVKIKHPSVRLIGTTTITNQVREELFTSNLRGQTTTHTDPEGNLTVYVRYPFSDPEGDGAFVAPGLGGKQYGQLKEVHVDADPNDVLTLVGADGDLVDFIPGKITRTNTPGVYQDLTTRYEGAGAGGGCSSCAYDSLGNPLATTDPRGFTTRYERNELGEIYRTIAPLPYLFKTETYYDANRNVVRTDVEDQVVAFDSDDPTSACYAKFTPSGGGTTAHVPMKPGLGGSVRPGWFTNLTVYDLLDNVVERDLDSTGSFPASLVTRTEYDANQNPIRITKPEGNTVEYDYDERNLRIAERVGFLPGDPDVGQPGAVTVSAYDGNGNLLQVIGPAQRGVVWESEEDAGNGQGVTIGDFFHSDVTVTHIGDFALENTYDGFDRVISAKDAVGNVVTQIYDPDGRVIEIGREGPIGGTTPLNRDGDDNTLLSLQFLRFDEAGRPYEDQREVFAAIGTDLGNPSLTTTHTGGGLATNSTANDHTDTFVMLSGGVAWDYYSATYVLERTVYDRAGRSTDTMTDNAAIFTKTYDGAARVIRALDPLNNAVDYGYDRNSNVTFVTRTEKCTITDHAIADEIFRSGTLYDSLNRPVVQAAQGADGSFDIQMLSCLSGALWNVPVETLISRTGYDSRGNSVVSIDAKGNTSFTKVDGASRAVQVVKHLRDKGQGDFPPAAGTTFLPHGGGSVTTTSILDGNGQLKQLVDDRGGTTTYAYDLLDRQITMTFHDGSTRTRAYDQAGDVVTYTDENGSVLAQSYDPLGRRTAVAVTRALGVVGTTAKSYEYDGLSRVRFSRDAVGSSFADAAMWYDSLGRLLQEQQSLSTGGTFSVPVSAFASYPTTQYLGRVTTFDKLYRIATLDPGLGLPIAWSYFGPSRLAELRSYGNSVIQSFMNNARTRSAVQSGLPTPAWGDQSSDRLGYDGAGRMITKRYLKEGINGTTKVYNNPQSVVGITTTYDRAGNKLYERHLQAESRSHLYEPFDSNDDPAGGYDSLDRNRQYQRGALASTGGQGGIGGGSITIPITLPNAMESRSYDLDGVGNWKRTTYDPVGGAAATQVRQHNALNEITRTTVAATNVNFLYDGAAGHSNGNLKNDGVRSYEWDAFNRLITVNRVSDNALIATYVYDAFGRRLSAAVTNGGLSGSVPNAVTKMTYSGWRCLQDTTGSVTHVYHWGRYLDELVFVYSTELSYTTPMQDMLYRTVGQIDLSGVVREAYDTDFYGNTLIFRNAGSPPAPINFTDSDTQVVVPGSPYIFTGQRFDAESGLYFFKKRYFSPELGRFISRDPLGYYDSNNLFEYLRSQPALLLDPFGLAVQEQGNGVGPIGPADANNNAAHVAILGAWMATLLARLTRGNKWLSGMVPSPLEGAILAHAASRGFGADSRNNWVYTCNCGWIDLAHFWTSVMGGYYLGWKNSYALGVAVEFAQDRGPNLGAGWQESAWTVEDLTSDMLGSLFGNWLQGRQAGDISVGFQKMMKTCGAVEITAENRADFLREVRRLNVGQDPAAGGNPARMTEQNEEYKRPEPWRGELWDKVCCGHKKDSFFYNIQVQSSRLSWRTALLDLGLPKELVKLPGEK